MTKKTKTKTKTRLVPVPVSMFWQFDGYRFKLDEDGLHLLGCRDLESIEVEQMIGRYEAIREQIGTGALPVPRPPTADERAALSWSIAQTRANHEAVQAVKAAFEPTTDVPF